MVGLTSSFFFVFLYFENRDFLHIKKKKKNAFRIKLKATFLCY